MGVGRFVSALTLVALAAASIGDNSIDGDDREVQVAPVLAPPWDSGTPDITRSRQFPILVLLALRNPPVNVKEHEAKSLEEDRPVHYVQKLEDQPLPNPGRNRQKRHAHKWKHGGGGGGGGSPVVIVVSGGGGGGGRHHGGGGNYKKGGQYYPSQGGGGYPYQGGGCGGGCGGNNGGGSYSYARAESGSGSYGRK